MKDLFNIRNYVTWCKMSNNKEIKYSSLKLFKEFCINVIKIVDKEKENV